MSNVERVREALLGQPSDDYFRQRAFAGWKPVAIIWERPIQDPDTKEQLVEDIPYGLSIGDDCCTLVENSKEKQVILKVIEGIVRDERISLIAAGLSQDGFRTRQGRPWTARDVFELLPRLIEVGPRVFPTTEWAERRQQLFNAF